VDGPAYEGATGHKEWWLNGRELSEEDLKKEVAKLARTENINVAEKVTTIPVIANKVIKLAKADGKEVLKRVAAQKTVLFINNFIVEMLTKDLAASQRKSTKIKLSRFLLTEEGKILTGMILGTSLPMLLERLPKKYHTVLNELSTEFRVQAETVALTKAADTILPKIQEFLTLKDKFDSSLVRVALTDEVPSSTQDDAEVELARPSTNTLLN
jgi:hypothetical protein